MITITVAGGAGEGKSAVALLIAKVLAEHGIKATLDDTNGLGMVEEAPGVIESTLPKRLNSIAKHPKGAIVKTVQMSRSEFYASNK